MSEYILPRARTIGQKKVKRGGWRRSVRVALGKWLDLTGILVTIGVMALVSAYLLYLGHIRGEVVALGHDVLVLGDEIRSLEKEVNDVRLEYEQLGRKDRLTAEARKLNLKESRLNQRIGLHEDP